MPKVVDGRNIQRKRTADEMYDALNDFRHGRRIPLQADSDIVLSDTIAELLELRAKVEELRGWMTMWLAKDARK